MHSASCACRPFLVGKSCTLRLYAAYHKSAPFDPGSSPLSYSLWDDAIRRSYRCKTGIDTWAESSLLPSNRSSPSFVRPCLSSVEKLFYHRKIFRKPLFYMISIKWYIDYIIHRFGLLFLNTSPCNGDWRLYRTEVFYEGSRKYLIHQEFPSVVSNLAPRVYRPLDRFIVNLEFLFRNLE